MPVRTSHHLEANRHVPNTSFHSVRSTYELIRVAAARDPERTAIAFLSGEERLDRSEDISFDALLNGLHQTANLLADLGVGSQDVIALLLPDLLETHLIFGAVRLLGSSARFIPSSPLSRPSRCCERRRQDSLLPQGQGWIMSCGRRRRQCVGR
jgi:acyl-CoA synthetase (AMP-forming)/AMP-acid ligase II